MGEKEHPLRWVLAFACAVLVFPAATLAGPNLLRNGNFEGTRRHWAGKADLDATTAAMGDCSLRLEGEVRSDRFELPAGKKLTVALWVRGQGHVRGKIESGRSDVEFTRAVEPQWSRVSWEVTLPEGTKESSLCLAPADGEIWVDGVSVTDDGSGRETYVPSSDVEVVLEATNLEERLKRGDQVMLMASLFNASSAEREVSIRWELLDKDSKRVLDSAEDSMPLPAGGSRIIARRQELKASGKQTARITVRNEAGKVLGTSQLKLDARGER